MYSIYFYISRFPVECLYAYKHTHIRTEVHIYFLWCVSVYMHCGVQCVYMCASLKSAALRSVPESPVSWSRQVREPTGLPLTVSGWSSLGLSGFHVSKFPKSAPKVLESSGTQASVGRACPLHKVMLRLSYILCWKQRSFQITEALEWF